MIDNSEVINSFLEETMDLLQKWEQECLDLEKDQNEHDYGEMFRIAHNIKGSAKMFALEDLSNYVHHLEDVINLLRNKKADINFEVIELFLEGHSILTKWILELKEDITYVIPDLEGSIKHINNVKLKLENNGVKEVNVAEEVVVKEIVQNLDVNMRDINFEDDLIINNLDKYVTTNKFEDEKNYFINIKCDRIDTAGIQYLISLIKTNNILIKMKCDNQKILDTFKLLGVTRFIL
ncbi:MAG: Hpt domain-containing protein [Oligoflexia bacterium]|nr:Hpt domain-containing protein [Oligoflexia bacterium]